MRFYPWSKAGSLAGGIGSVFADFRPAGGDVRFFEEFLLQPPKGSCTHPSSLATAIGARVAQLVEHVTENHGVGGSTPPPGTTFSSRR